MSKISIGPKIKQLRKERGITQEELANKLGYSGKSVISHIEKGDADMTYDKIILLIREYMLDANVLFDVQITHKMKLWNDSFDAIKSGSKTIEMRLNDEKRSKIYPGDYIEFTNTQTNECITVVVEELFKYKSFEKLYKEHDKISLGYKEDEDASADDMLAYYSKEDIKKYGVIAIKISVQ